MKTPSLLSHCRSAGAVVPCRRRTVFAGFTLVEMLVVIAIIAILAGLITPVAIRARTRAKIGVIVVELSQLDAACKAYKEKFGEYPPDFAGVAGTTTQQAVLRHLATAFPRYQPGISTGGTPTNDWAGFVTDVQNGWHINVNSLSPAMALTFWLGGAPDWLIDTTGASDDVTLYGTTKVRSSQPVTGFLGFSANPLNPFDGSASRIKPFYDFDVPSLGWPPGSGFAYWPRVQAVTTKTAGGIVYFRAEGNNYTVDGAVPNQAAGASNNVKNQDLLIWPAYDTRSSNVATPTITWVNQQSFQIFASGLDLQYGSLTGAGSANFYGLAYPTGESPPGTINYAPETYDDITNFSGGTLQDKIP